MAVERPTVRVSNISLTATAQDLLTFIESILGPHSVFACQIFSDHKNWKSRGHGRIQFYSIDTRNAIINLSLTQNLEFNGSNLSISSSNEDIIVRPIEDRNRVDEGVLHVGLLENEECMCVLESWSGVNVRFMPERKRVEFLVEVGLECYKLEVCFHDVFEAFGCCLDASDRSNGVLLKLKHGPKIYKKISGPNIASKFRPDRYHICKEDCEFLWVRSTDFSTTKSIGQSSSLCWEIKNQSSVQEIFSELPYFKQDKKNLTLEETEDFCSASDLVPLVECGPDSKLSYEILFQINSLVQTQKISLASVDTDLIEILASLSIDTAMMIIQKLHKLKSTCYNPISFVKTQLHIIKRNSKNLPSSSQNRLKSHNSMSCHRILITPTKIYCLGPEIETSNYVVKNFASHASNFARVTFVEEDWSKLSSNAVSTSIQQGFFSKPFRTKIYDRILSILRDGIVIGAKRFEFLAFSASQLRSNSVWMFASNEDLKAEDIREWMGCFNKIRSVSKCAARMGQLFSSSVPTLVVPIQDVEVIPDVESINDGINYCFSDGIGKISLNFARQVAQKCGLNKTPSAFQIRYGGYKGVIAVDRNSFRKVSLRSSMLKFESKNRMLNVTSWSESMPCFLNREIVTLLSTLGVEDENFEKMQNEQILLLDKILTNRKAALDFLEHLNSSDIKDVLVNMLLKGYEPNLEPYLSMMIQAHRENHLADIRTRCRVFVLKGRILIGCLDEKGILDYGQVYVRVSLTKAELKNEDQSCLRKVDETTAIVVGKVVVTKNPCLHPGDIRVLDAVYDKELEGKGLTNCVVFPQKGDRPHPNECSGGDLDGDLFFICWDENLIPPQTDNPMDYTPRRPRIMDHDVTLEEIQHFFVDYMINDTLGAISTAHLVHADRDPERARSQKCIQLATLHSMAVDFAKTGAPAEMPWALQPREFPDFMERIDKPMYTSTTVLGKLFRATLDPKLHENTPLVWSQTLAESTYDRDLETNDYDSFLEIAEAHKALYVEKLSYLMNFYGAESEDEIVTGNLRRRSVYLQRDNRRYGEVKDRIILAVKTLHKEMKEVFEGSCGRNERQKMASAWYHVTYHPSYCQKGVNYLSFPWIVGEVLMNIKTLNINNSSKQES